MDCDFRVGHSVVCVDADDRLDGHVRPAVDGRLIRDATYTIECGGIHDGEVGVVLAEVRSLHLTGMFLASRFRRAQKSDSSLTIESFLTIKPGYEEPKRTPAKKRARVHKQI